MRSPHTGKPYTEEMLFGLGGGLGFGYWVFDFAHMPEPMISIGFRRCGWEGFDLAFVDDMCSRAGVDVQVRETSSRAMAQRSLVSTLAEGTPAIVTLDWGKLSGSPMPDEIEYVPHVVTACGTTEDGEGLLVDDLASKPAEVSLQEMAAARCAVRSTHHRVRLLTPGGAPPDPVGSILDAIAECASSLLEPEAPNSGLAALHKWSRMIGSRSESKAWRSVFSTPARLGRALAWSSRWIEVGTGGGGFRRMYADFLDEAAGVLGDRSLHHLASDYRSLGEQWASFAGRTAELSEQPEAAFGELDALGDRLEGIYAEESVAAAHLREVAAQRMSLGA